MVVQQQKQNSAYKAFKGLKQAIDFETDVAFDARVVKYDKSAHTADIVPINNGSDGSSKAQLLDVPVSKNCYAMDEWFEKVKGEFAKIDAYVDDGGVAIGTGLVGKIPKPMMATGATVICTVMDHDTDNWDGSSKSYTPSSNRQHDINDAQIVGVI